MYSIGLLVVSIIIAVKRRKERKKEGVLRLRDSSMKGIVIVLSIADALFIGFFVYLFCVFSINWYTKLFYILIGTTLWIFLTGRMTQWLRGAWFIVVCSCFVLAVAGLWGSYRYDRYLQEISVPESFDYKTYTPFVENSPVATLDEESTFRLTDERNLPKMDGATALYPVYASFAQACYPQSAWEWEPAETRETVSCSTTNGAYYSLIDGECDIIFVAGPSEEQERRAKEKGVELNYIPIGREAFVFFVNPENPIDGLTLSEIRSIYSGEITRWEQLGVSDMGDILAYQRDEGSGSQTALERFVMRGTPLMPAEKEKRVGGMGGIVEAVSTYKNHKNAIGFSFRFYCTALMKDFDVKLLTIDGVEPTVENIENGTYPLASSFYAVVRDDASPETLALVDWICGEQGQELVKKAGYTPIH